jgi:hypothetical protein
MPEPISLILAGTLLKGVTATSAKVTAAGAAKAGAAGAAKASAAKAAAGAAKATVHATSCVATYGPGAIGATATAAILGTCWATSTMLAIATCLAIAVDGDHMSESSARYYCEKIDKKSSDEKQAILKDLQQAPPDKARSILHRHGIYGRTTLFLRVALFGVAGLAALAAGAASQEDD